MLLHKAVAGVLLVASWLACFTANAAADDFAPPPWDRAHPHAVTAEWEFFAPVNPLGPDGPLTNVGAKGSGSVASSATIVGTGGLGWGIGDGDGGWFFPDGGSIRITLDNVIDTEPVKHLWLQVTHTPGLAIAVDPLFAFNASATGSTPTPPVMVPHGPTSTFFHWDMFPNPPWEEFTVLVFGTGEVDQVLVDTISIPEPSSFVLGAIGLLTLVFAARRRIRRA